MKYNAKIIHHLIVLLQTSIGHTSHPSTFCKKAHRHSFCLLDKSHATQSLVGAHWSLCLQAAPTFGPQGRADPGALC
jgi:hypothetical protein